MDVLSGGEGIKRVGELLNGVKWLRTSYTITNLSIIPTDIFMQGAVKKLSPLPPSVDEAKIIAGLHDPKKIKDVRPPVEFVHSIRDLLITSKVHSPE